MMNGDLVNELALRWAVRVGQTPGGEADKIQAMYETAFSRPANAEEMKLGLAFLASHGGNWKEYAHVLLSATEFAYVR